MFEVIGIIAVWLFVGWAFICVPAIVGMWISSRRKDDGRAMYISLPISATLAAAYLLATVIYLAAT